MISPSQRPLPDKHTTFTTEKHPCPRRNSNPQSQQTIGRRHASSTPRPLGLAERHITWPNFWPLLTCRPRDWAVSSAKNTWLKSISDQANKISNMLTNTRGMKTSQMGQTPELHNRESLNIMLQNVLETCTNLFSQVLWPYERNMLMGLLRRLVRSPTSESGSSVSLTGKGLHLIKFLVVFRRPLMLIQWQKYLCLEQEYSRPQPFQNCSMSSQHMQVSMTSLTQRQKINNMTGAKNLFVLFNNNKLLCSDVRLVSGEA